MTSAVACAFVVMCLAIAVPAGPALPGSGRAPVPAPPGSGEPEGGSEGDSEEILGRDDWFYAQRAFPHRSIPEQALSRARSDMRRLEPSGPGFARAASLSWTEMGPRPISETTDTTYYNGVPPWSGRVTAIAAHPTDQQIAYAGTAVGGVWKTTNAGATWTPLFDTKPSLAIGALVIDPADPDRLFAGTGEANLGTQESVYFGDGIYRSTDAGATWTKVGGSMFDDCYVADITIRPGNSNVMLAAVHGIPAKTGHANGCGSRQGIYRSTDAGTVWAKEVTGTPTDLSVSADQPAVVYAGFYGYGVWKSTNSGVDWAQLTGGTLPVDPIGGAGRVAVAAAPSNGGRVYVAVAGCLSRDAGCPLSTEEKGDMFGMWTTGNGGTTWTEVETEAFFCDVLPGEGRHGQCYYDLTLAVNPTNASVFYAGGIYLFRYNNSGGTHTLLGWDGFESTIHVDFHALALSGTRLWVGSDGGMYRSDNAGASFANVNADLGITQFYPGTAGTFAGPFVGGTQDNGTVKFTGGPGWNEITAGDGGYAAVNPSETSMLYTTYAGLVVYKSTNGGTSFERVDDGMCTEFTEQDPGPRDPCEFIAPLVMDPDSPSILYAGTDRLWRTTDAAVEWLPISPQLSGNVSAIGVPAGASTTLYVGTVVGELQVSVNGGSDWTNTAGNGLPTRFISDILVSPTNAAVAYVAVSGFGTGHVFRTTNSGGTWTDISGNLPNVPVSAVAVDWTSNPRVLYAGTDVGVLTSVDGGGSWQASSGGLPNTVVNDLLIDPASQRIIAATYGRGAWASPLLTPGPTGARTIVFVSERDGDAEIFSANEDGTGVTQLTDNAVGDYDPVVSPDGSKIAFSSGRDGDYDVWVMDADGSNPTAVTDNSGIVDEFPSWSANGNMLAFDSNADGDFDIFKIGLDGTGRTKLTSNDSSDKRPSWSPASNVIAFDSNADGDRDIYRMTSAGASRVKLTNNTRQDFDPAISPDGTKIVFDSNRDGDYEIFTMTVNGGNQTKRTSNAATDEYPAWSATGTAIAFDSDRDGDYEIFTMTATGGSQRKRTSNATDDYDPSWGPG